VLSDGAASYVYAGGLVSEVRGGTSKFYHSDALGTTRAITNSGGSTTDSLTTDAFGMTVSGSGSTPTPFGFAGQAGYQSDPETGLMRLGHRYYDNSTGHFISRDMILDGYNWYTYCGNDPVNAVDPSGLSSNSLLVGVASALVIIAIGGPVGVAIIVGTVGAIGIGMAESQESGGSFGDMLIDGAIAGIEVYPILETGGLVIGSIPKLPPRPRPAPSAPSLPGDTLIYHGGMPKPFPSGEWSAQLGPAEQAGLHLPHNKLTLIGTVDEIIAAGGSLTLKPEPYNPGRPDLMNPGHVAIELPPTYVGPGITIASPIPSNQRIPNLIKEGKL
jgi:RHS repeat-associated protein